MIAKQRVFNVIVLVSSNDTAVENTSRVCSVEYVVVESSNAGGEFGD